MRKPSVVHAIAATTFVMVVTACGTSTTVTSESGAAGYAPKQLVGQKLMVLAAAKRPEMQKTFEDEFVKQLQQAGVNAVPSYNYVKPEDRTNVQAVKQAVVSSGVDTALVLRLVGTRQDLDLGASNVEIAQMAGYYNASMSSQSPEYAFTVYSTDARLFDVKQDKQVWSSKAETKDPNNVKNNPEAAAKEYADKIIKSLKSAKPA